MVLPLLFEIEEDVAICTAEELQRIRQRKSGPEDKLLRLLGPAVWEQFGDATCRVRRQPLEHTPEVPAGTANSATERNSRSSAHGSYGFARRSPTGTILSRCPTDCLYSLR